MTSTPWPPAGGPGTARLGGRLLLLQLLGRGDPLLHLRHEVVLDGLPQILGAPRAHPPGARPEAGLPGADCPNVLDHGYPTK